MSSSHQEDMPGRDAPDAPPTPAPDNPRRLIDIKILGPSEELRNGIQFTGIPKTITIAELKERIQNELPSHPAPTKQRLIYLGRVLQPETETLLHFLGESSVQQSATHTLHLVFRDHAPHIRPDLASPASPSQPSQLSSSIPRPSSVPPQNPHRPFGGAAPGDQPNPFRRAPNRPLTPRQTQPSQSPLSQLLQHGNVDAQVNINGQPVNLPLEVINNLLNQQFNATAQMQLLQALQNQQQATANQQQTAGNQPDQQANTSPSDLANPTTQRAQPSPSERTEGSPNIPQIPAHRAQRGLQQAIAQAQQARAAAGRHGISDTAVPQINSNLAQNNGPATSHPTIVNASQSEQSPQSGTPQQPPVQSAPGPPPIAATAPNRPLNIPQLGQLPFPIPLQPGQIPQGQTFTMTFNAGNIPHQIPGFPQVFPPPAFPQAFAQAFPPAFQPPHPMMQNPALGQARTATPARPGTPHLIPPYQARSASPARSSQPQTLQQRIDLARSNLEVANRMVDTLATDRNADGTPAQPLSLERAMALRGLVTQLLQHLDSVQRELNAIAESMPSAVNLPDYTQARNALRSLSDESGEVSRRINELTSSVRNTGAESPQPAAQIRFQQMAHPLPTPTIPAPAVQPTPNIPSDTPTTAASPELRLLTNSAGQPQALLIGPTGRHLSSPLSTDILYALLASQLPHDQLVQEFSTIMREAANLVMGVGAPTAPAPPTAALPTPTPTAAPQANADQQHPAAQPPPAQPQNPPDALDRLVAAIAGQPRNPQQPAQQAADAPPPAAQAQPNGAAQNGAANRPPDEIRDILAPIVRNIWLLFRIGLFLYFFNAGGRPSWRLILMALGVLAVWAIQNGWFGANVGAEGMRRHFEGLFGLENRRERQPEIRANRRLSQTEARPASRGENNQQTAASSSARGQAEPNPEDAARRLIQRNEEANRSRILGQLRAVERTVALFLASLWPGVGENVVRVQEQRRREEERRQHEAEVEAKKKEEEERKRIEGGEASSSTVTVIGDAPSSAAAGSSTSGADVAPSDGVNRVNKGKAKASEEEVAAQEGETSTPAMVARDE